MKLRIRVVRDEFGTFTALCPSLPGCLSHGSSREEACQRLDEAVCGYIAAVNNFVPEHLTHEFVDA